MGEKFPLEGTLGFDPLQIIYMHTNLHNTLQERETPKKGNRASLKCLICEGLQTVYCLGAMFDCRDSKI